MFLRIKFIKKKLFDGNNIFVNYFFKIIMILKIFKNGRFIHQIIDELNEIIKPEMIFKFPNDDQKIIQINN